MSCEWATAMYRQTVLACGMLTVCDGIMLYSTEAGSLPWQAPRPAQSPAQAQPLPSSICKHPCHGRRRLAVGWDALTQCLLLLCASSVLKYMATHCQHAGTYQSYHDGPSYWEKADLHGCRHMVTVRLTSKKQDPGDWFWTDPTFRKVIYTTHIFAQSVCQSAPEVLRRRIFVVQQRPTYC